MMIEFKRSKVIQFASLSFLIKNQNKNDIILKLVSIFEMIGYLCCLSFENTSRWKRTFIYDQIYFNYTFKVRFLEIFEILIDNYISSNDKNLKTAENLKFLSQACKLLLNQNFKAIFNENYSRFIIILTKLYVHDDICYIEQDNKVNVDHFIRNKLNKLGFNSDNNLILIYSKSEKADVKKTLENWNLLHKISEKSNQNIAEIIKELLRDISSKSFYNLNTFELVKISHLILKNELKVHTNVEQDIFNAIVKKMESQKDLNYLTELSEYNNKLVNNLIQEVIIKKWPQSNDPYGILNFLFECNNFLKIFLYEKVIKQNKILEDKTLQIISLLDNILNELISGEIVIYIFQIIYEHNTVFCELYSFFENTLSTKFKENINLDTIKRFLQVRFFQIKCFQDFQSLMFTLVDFFRIIASKNIQINYGSFENKLERLKDYKTKKIIDICECNLDDGFINQNNFENRLKHFDEIDKNKINKIKNFVEFSQDNIYLLFYIKETVNECKKSIAVEDFVNETIDVSMTKYNNLGNNLKNGKLELDYFSNELVKIGKNLKIEKENELYKEELEKVMRKADMSKDQIEICLKKLKNYLNLPKIKEISELLLVIREKENLSGDYQPLEQISESVIFFKNCIFFIND